jgi:ketosteroid isomerase-like protein
VSQDLSLNLQQSILNASLAGNIDAIVSLFADDAVVMPPNDTTLFGKTEIQAWWEDYFQYFRIVSSAESEHELTVVDDQAFERGAASVVIVPKEQGPRIRDDIRVFAVWKRGLSGAWKVSHWIWNSTKPVGSGTNRYMTRMLQRKKTKASSTVGKL